MTWEPRAEILNQILTFLKQSQSTNEVIQRNVQMKLEELNHYPEFNNYLIYVLTKLTSQDEPTRSLSGKFLMNNIKSNATTLQPAIIEYIKEECLLALVDPSKQIRDTVGLIILATIAHKDGLLNWPELLTTLCAMLDSKEFSCKGALDALQMICENPSEILDSNEQMVPKFLQFCRHTSSKIHSHDSACINHQTQTLMVHIDTFIDKLLHLLSDEDHEVRKIVCRGLVILLDIRMDHLIPNMNSIIEYMLVQTQDQDDIALEACKFWLSLAEHPICKEVLGPHLHKLAPVLVKGMKYSDIDIIILKGDIEEDEMIPDREEDIGPRYCLNIGDSDDEEEEGLVDYDNPSNWDLRLYSVNTLVKLAIVCKDETLPILLPILKETIFHEQWVIKESGILALGAIAEGCMQGMIPHLPELIPFLIACLSEKKALVSSITCWTLSRYAHWVVNQPHEQYLKPLMERLLKCILDANRRVQKLACCALATLHEACTELVPYLGFILKTLVVAFSKYQHKNLLILYDAIDTIAYSVGHHLNKPEYIDMLMPPLIQKFDMLKVGNKDENTHLFQCLLSVAISLESGFLPYFDHVYCRCISLIEQTLNLDLASTTSPGQIDLSDGDLMLSALELLTELINRGLKIHIERFVMSSNIMHLLHRCMKDSIPEVRETSFLLVGYLTRAYFELVLPFIPDFLPILGQNLSPDHFGCRMSMWAIGEISIKLGAETKPFIPLVLGQLIEIIIGPNTPKALLEQTARTIGRIGFACPIEVAPSLKEFFRQWCSCMCNHPDDKNKDSAFRNMCQIIKVNPSGAVPDFIYFCDAAATLKSAESDVHEIIQNILHGFKTQVGDGNWHLLVEQLPPQIAERLNGMYKI